MFLLERGYMDYHSDRFEDHSLVFRRNGSIVGVLPATRHGDDLHSHGGLTFGGLVLSPRAGAALVLEIMDRLMLYLDQEGFRSLLYKAVPHIYHTIPAEEDLYALFRVGARLVRRDVSSTIGAGPRLAPSKGRKSALAGARRRGIHVERSEAFDAFMGLEERELQRRHGTRPVHTGDEMARLALRYPENIALYTARLDGELVAGTIVYESPQVAHTQYIAASDRGREVGAMDLVLHHLLADVYSNKQWFDFGISTEQAGRHLNTGLIAYKESYGARATVYDFYELAPLAGTRR